MKKTGIINADISRVLSYMGHTDRIAVGGCPGHGRKNRAKEKKP